MSTEKKKFGSKSEFVKKQPKSATAAEVVAKAKEAGIELSTAYVYAIRSNSGKAAKPSPKSAKTPFRSIQEYVLRVGSDRALSEVQGAIRAVESRLGL